MGVNGRSSPQTGSSHKNMPNSIFAHLSPNCDFKLLRWILIRNIVKVQARFICKLESYIGAVADMHLNVRNIHTPRFTHQCNFLRSLITWTGFQKERPQLDGAGERHANDSSRRNPFRIRPRFDVGWNLTIVRLHLIPNTIVA